jgi:hypothetical protein
MGAHRREIAVLRRALIAAVMLTCGGVPAFPGPASTGGSAAAPQVLPGLHPGDPVSIETVLFADPHHPPVRLVRGIPPAAPAAASPAAETLTFGRLRVQRVAVMRGSLPPPASRTATPLARIETVSFADPNLAPVTVVRGAASRNLAIGLFDAAQPGELDRIAFAVDGVESRHGNDPRMWRPGLSGPQGPMQVSLAAALDVGGGDRFDLRDNRALGRAYLAQMFRRYGNWPDAVAAYNWGPGNMDLWIAAGRPAEKLPLGVGRYVLRVMRDALVAAF